MFTALMLPTTSGTLYCPPCPPAGGGGATAPPGAVLEGGYTVDNGAKPHQADFYLTKAQVGHPIGALFSGIG